MKRTETVLSHWHTLIDNYTTSGQDFYRAIEIAIREREVPEVQFSRVDFKEGGFASSKREYLRIERQFVAFDICAAPYGTSFFFSWWLTRLGPKHPILYLLAFLVLMLFGSHIVASFLSAPLPGFLAIMSWFIAPFIVLGGLGYLARQRVFGPEEHIMMLPLLGWLYVRLFNPVTYYSMDTALMFQESVRRAVNEVINTLLSDQGLQALAETEMQPTLRSLVE